MAASGNGIGAEEQELPLFQHPSSPCAYYVQSPSAASHHTLSSCHPASESACTALILSPFPDAAFSAPPRSRHDQDQEQEQEASRLALLSRYSSSRGSNNSFLLLTDKQPTKPAASSPRNNNNSSRRQVLRVLSAGRESDEDDEERNRSGAWRYVKLDPEASCCCIAFQVAWRAAVSLAVALLVFVAATSPSRPGVSFRVGKIERFSLGEGLDGSGVITAFLDCNCSVEMAVENHSRVFALRLLPDDTLLQMSFGGFAFAASRGNQGAPGVVVGPGAASTVRLFVAAREKPMYAAGRGMQDMLESPDGAVAVTITVSARSRYRVVGSLVWITYRHDSRCVVYLRRRDDALAAAGAATCSAATS